MSVKYGTFVFRALMVLALLSGGFLVTLPCYAGGAVILVPEEDRDVPKGSQIPEERSKEIEEKVEKYKEQIREQNKQKQEQLLQEQSPKPDGNQ